MKIGIVGYGILGFAINEALKGTYETVLIDPPKALYGSIEGCDNYILCLPTPENEDGSCDISIVKEYLHNLKKYNILLKSTIDPGQLEELSKEYNFVYSPEFLKESSSVDDFKNQTLAIFAGNEPKSVWWWSIFDPCVKMHNVSFTSIQKAARIKYAINTFLATKVIFFNELREIYDDFDQEDWEEFTSLVSLDPRIGNSHLQVPGPDGKKGFGGMCFPKDTKAFVKYAEKKGTKAKLLERVIEINEEIR
jgi:nucleotide sugar dehydrogenase